MEEPSLRKSRFALAGGLTAVIVLAGGGFLLGRATTERLPVLAAPSPISAHKAEPPPKSSAPRGVLDRLELIAIAAAAADAAAAGVDQAGTLSATEGRRFELRLPFGCNGPSDEKSKEAMRWRYDPDTSALRLHVEPVSWTVADWWTDEGRSNNEALEGFWMMRPWTSSESCPPRVDGIAAVGVEPITFPGQTLAIGQRLSGEQSLEGDRSVNVYRTVLRVPEEDLDTSAGFRLRITGRIASIRNDVVRCHQPLGPNQRPICLVGVNINEIAIENGASDETLATWSVDRRDPTRN